MGAKQSKRLGDSSLAEIYALSDPRTGLVRYIGKANCSRRRFAGHIRDSRRRDTPVYRWLRELISLGLMPNLLVIEVVSAHGWKEAERRHIAAHAGLLNVAPGGSEPCCSTQVRAANGKANAASRNKRLWYLKLCLAQALRSGFVTPATRARMESRPDLFGQMLAAYQ